MFLCYANEESDDIIGGSTKTAQHSIKNNSRNIKAVFFKLGTSNVHHEKENVILHCSEKPFKQAAIIFYFIGTLTYGLMLTIQS